MRERGIAAGVLVILAAVALWLMLGDSSSGRETSAPAASSLGSASPGVRRVRPKGLPAGPTELALVAPLEVGRELAGWEIRFIGAAEAGRLRVALGQAAETIALDVMLASEEGPEPPAATNRYHIYYRSRGARPEEATRLSRALAEVIAKNGHVEPPSGLTTYRDPGRDPWTDGI